MIEFLLDTNTVIALLRSRASLAGERLRSRPADAVATSSIVMFELYYGAFRSARSVENSALLDALNFQVLPFDEADGRQAGDIRAELRAGGNPIGPYDLLIAGQARARDLTLVTNNLREFHRIEGLRVEDWTVP